MQYKAITVISELVLQLSLLTINSGKILFFFFFFKIGIFPHSHSRISYSCTCTSEQVLRVSISLCKIHSAEHKILNMSKMIFNFSHCGVLSYQFFILHILKKKHQGLYTRKPSLSILRLRI